MDPTLIPINPVHTLLTSVLILFSHVTKRGKCLASDKEIEVHNLSQNLIFSAVTDFNVGKQYHVQNAREAHFHVPQS
jgi:hypothetical protein